MIFSSVEIDQFRNLRHVSLTCSPGLNLIFGENASGKTSLLEALYFLGRARSFRTRQVRELIGDGAAAFRLVARMSSGAEGRSIPVGIERSLRTMTIRIDGTDAPSLADLALQVPVLLLNPNSHRLLEEGPQQRRRFMDWGLFHQDPGFLPVWRRFTTALRHRNAALRQGADNRSIDAWDGELIRTAEVLEKFRQAFCSALETTLTPLVAATLGAQPVTVDYRRGWAQEQELAAVLHQGRDQDRRQGHTRYGPQRADFSIRLDGRIATEHLSRGQQKLLVIALVLAQAQLYRQHRDNPCVLLIDDLPAELDNTHRQRVMHCLAKLDSQLFVTAIEPTLLDSAAWTATRRFILRAGTVQEGV